MHVLLLLFIAQLCFMCLFVLLCVFVWWALCLTCYKYYPARSFSANSAASPKKWVSECGLRRTATTEQWCSYGECKTAMHLMFVKCLWHRFCSADVQRNASIIVWNLWNGICYRSTTIVRVRMVRMSRMSSHSAMQVMWPRTLANHRCV